MIILIKSLLSLIFNLGLLSKIKNNISLNFSILLEPFD